jgi:hypothetical protein
MKCRAAYTTKYTATIDVGPPAGVVANVHYAKSPVRGTAVSGFADDRFIGAQNSHWRICGYR